jgi:hypothetical protein
LSHEEMDMMRPVSVAIPPKAPTSLAGIASGKGNNQIVTLTWTDASVNETSFIVQRGLTATGPWANVATLPADTQTYTDPVGSSKVLTFYYQVVAANAVGYNGVPGYSTLTVTAATSPLIVGVSPEPPTPPTNLTAVAQAGPQVLLSFIDTSTVESGFIIERSTDNGTTWAGLVQLPFRNGTGSVSFTDVTVFAGNTYQYRVAAVNAGSSVPYPYSNIATATIPAPPLAPTNVLATAAQQGGNAARVTLTWTDVANNETGYRIQRSTNAAFTANLVTSTVGANVTTFTTGNVARFTPFYFRVQAFNGVGPSVWVNATPFPITTP